MVYFGTVMETDKNKTYVFTLDCEMVALKTKQEYYVGQQVSFHKKDVYKTSNIIDFAATKNFKIISTIAAVFLLALIIAGGAFYLGRGSAGGFDEKVRALVSVDINPSIEFEINENNEIISANCYNNEGQDIIDSLDFRGMVLQQGINEVVAAAKELGYINEDVNIVLVSGTLYGDDTDNSYAAQLKKVLEGLQPTSGEASIMAVYVEDSSVFDLAQENDISIGKALLYQYALAQGLNISLSDIKSSSITQLLTIMDVQVADLEMETQTPTETTTQNTTQATTQSTTQPSNGNTNPSGGTSSGWAPSANVWKTESSIYFSWNPLTSTSYNGYYGFDFYKVVYSKTNPNPVYGESGTNYLTYFDNISTSSYSVSPQDAGLESGATYYFAITYVFENGKVSSNVVQMTVPPYTVSTTPMSSPILTNNSSGNNLSFTWTPISSDNVSYNGSNYYDFQYYKVVASKSNPNPLYPDDGYLAALGNSSWGVTLPDGSYNKDPTLESGSTYNIAITYVFKNGYKFSSNVIQYTIP